jgi:hypothetical protein
MYSPGYYKTNYRALRFRELVRMHGRRRAFKAYVVSRFMPPVNAGWMPSLWADTECRPEDLSEDCRQATKPHRQDFERLGFTECSCLKASKTLNPMVRDSGGITYLDPTRRHFGQLLYNRFYIHTTGSELNQITIAFTAVFERGSLSCTNNRKSFDPTDESEVIRVDSHDVGAIHQEFLRRMQLRKEAPREFPDLESLRRWFDARQVQAFEERARRRLFIPMSAEEVAAAKAGLNPPTPPTLTPPPRFKFRWGMWLVVVLAICGLQFLKHQKLDRAGLHRPDTIEYRGQEFKMRRAYASYEDYKDDPDNLDTKELDRIEQAMVSAQVPTTFKNREEFLHFMITDLEFPGYGLSILGGQTHADDGSKLEVDSVEIPQRNKDRFLVMREAEGQLKLVDDFIIGTATNEIERVTLEKQKLRYYDRQNRLVRERQL